MSTRLQDDLFHDFQEQRKFIHDQVKMFSPVAESLSRPAAVRILNKLTLIISEILCYLLCLSSIAFIFIMDKIPPFNIISTIMYDSHLRLGLGQQNVFILKAAVIGLICIIALLFYFLGVASRRLRLKNGILHIASKDIKILIGQLLRRKAAIEAIDQRHFEELPFPVQSVNIVPNPGFDPKES